MDREGHIDAITPDSGEPLELLDLGSLSNSDCIRGGHGGREIREQTIAVVRCALTEDSAGAGQ